ncbi:MAG: urate hydroxylase PuuD [Flavobacteriales bacterium]|nr:urate hydroxylase PuuD [Flavobacteriales bacterium]
MEVESSFTEKLMASPALPFMAFLCVLLLFGFLWFRRLARTLQEHFDKQEFSGATRFDLEEARSTAIASRQTAKFFGLLLFGGYLAYVAIQGTPMYGYAMEWLNLAVRWTHVIAGIMWIGASFYFIFLENNLNRTEGLRDELAGNLWAIHGGGFYYVEKYKVAPKEIPKHLHWFKYEAYFTWLSGVSLLFIVYYADARSFMIDPTIAELSTAAALGIGIGSMVLGWVIYDMMSRSRLVLRQDLFALVGLLVLGVITYALTHLLSGRAAYIHVGALLGTIMAGNVFFTIIPSQKALVRAAKTGQPLDASLGKKAGQRSLHNNYITLPVVFIMISNHFPSTFGHSGNWIVLMVITVASMGIKHYWNLLERGIKQTWVLVISILALVILSMAISPAFEDTLDAAIPATFEEANAVIQTRCIQCHSANPTDDQWPNAPNGVMYDTPQQIQAMADKIMTRAVRTHSMPLGNKTNMTEEERTVLKRWILQGAKTP